MSTLNLITVKNISNSKNAVKIPDNHHCKCRNEIVLDVLKVVFRTSLAFRARNVEEQRERGNVNLLLNGTHTLSIFQEGRGICLKADIGIIERMLTCLLLINGL